MAGNKAGGIKTREANLAKDPDYYRKMGAIGGKNSSTGGFAQGEAGRERARQAGSVGGKKSKPGKTTYVDYKGERVSLLEYSRRVGVNYETVRARYKRGAPLV
jgi:uncharacterized protein